MSENTFFIKVKEGDGQDNFTLEDPLCDVDESETFFKKICINFQPNTENANICVCGREKFVHRNVEVDCHMSNTTKTNAFGSIEFYNGLKKTEAKYIRFYDETPPDEVVNYLLNTWKLKSPKLVISITGGADSFKLNPKLKSLFATGIWKIAKSTSTWVVTGGTHSGVTKHVGEALQFATQTQYGCNKVYCIGIATWGVVANRKSLTNTFNVPVKYQVNNTTSKKTVPLDNNHTHFLLVDNGFVNQFGGETTFRANFEKSVRNLKICKVHYHSNVPGVLIVIEGGRYTIKTVVEAINQEPPLPVVVIKDSGRAADLIAFAYDLSKRGDFLYDYADYYEHDKLMVMIRTVFQHLTEDEYAEVYNDILKCVENKSLITIFEMEDPNKSLDEAILSAFLKDNRLHHAEKLMFAMLWNRADIARSQLFVKYRQWTDKDLVNNFKNALIRNKPDIVELILEQNFDVRSFLTKKELIKLYNLRAYKANRLIWNKLGEKKCRNQEIKIEDIDKLLDDLVQFPVRRALYVTLQSEKPFEYPYNELFIWACLFNLSKMARLFWTKGEEPLAKSLFAEKLFLQMSKKAERFHFGDDLIERMRNDTLWFGKVSKELLEECFLTDDIRTIKLITLNLNEWGNQTCLSLAVSSENMEFISHSCCQDLLSCTWTGALAISGNPVWKIILARLFPPAILFLNFRPREDLLQSIMTEKQHNNVKNKFERQKAKGKSVSVRIKKCDTCEFSSIITRTQKYEVKEIKTLSRREKIWFFYNAPMTKFWINLIVYLLFLGLYTYVITARLPKFPSYEEWVLVSLIVSYAGEELKQIMQTDGSNWRRKFKKWSTAYWNIWDAIAIVFFFIAFILRMNDHLIAGHVIYALDVMLWIIRLLDLFSVHKSLGPYVVMIWRMIMDMMAFIMILVVFVAAFGVARRTILHPKAERSWSTLGEIFFVPYFQIYGELFLEYPQFDSNKTMFYTDNQFKHIEPVMSLLMAAYFLITNVLLLNLLIAIFNNTYAKANIEAKLIWRFQRYNLVQEYSNRSFVFPPFVLIYHLWLIVCKCLPCKQPSKNDQMLKYCPTPDQLYKVRLFEENCLTNLLQSQYTMFKETQEEKLRVLSERMVSIDGVMCEFNKQTHKHYMRSDSATEKLDERIGIIEALLSSNLNRKSKCKTRRSIQRKRERMYSRRSFPNKKNPLQQSLPRESTGLKNEKNIGKSNEKTITMAVIEQCVVGNEGFDEVDTSVIIDTPQIYSESRREKNYSISQIESETTSLRHDNNSSADQKDSSDDEDVLNAVSYEESLDSTDSDSFEISRSPFLKRYPLSSVCRFPLRINEIDWKIEKKDYQPPEHTSILASPQKKSVDAVITGSDNSTCMFNEIDGEVIRVSFAGTYEVDDGFPRNPMGRTGLLGRGLLWRYGPNHITEPLFTRWKKKFDQRQEGILEVLVMKRKNTEFYSLPSGVKTFSEPIPRFLREVFDEISLKEVGVSPEKIQRYLDKLSEIMDGGVKIEESYLHDERNTDNAWLEVTAFNYHDQTQGVLAKFLSAGRNRHYDFHWLEICSAMDIPDYQKSWAQKVANLHGARFKKRIK